MSEHKKTNNYIVLLYYKYIDIDNPQQLALEQKQLCEKLGLKGRIIIAHEGINGTVEGTEENADAYIAQMSEDERFKDIHWKISEGNGNAFPKLAVKVRPEIVSLHLGKDDINPNQFSGKHLTPEELHQWFLNKKEFYIIDMRNDYEYKIGKFQDSVLPALGNFRDLPKVLSELEHLKDKTVVTVCTGGVRCEKASGVLVKHGFKEVYQLSGGIVSYMEKYPNQHFDGKLYVFDGRITMGFNTDSPEHKIISNCYLCGAKSDTYVDCGYIHCKRDRHFIACDDCRDENGKAFCSEDCKEKVLLMA